MVLRCSLLGHDYGDAEVEREREERGSEVVVTVQEYEECTRCGERNVISENTEVTSLAGTAADSAPDEPDSAPDEQPETDGTEIEYTDDDAELLEDADEPAAEAGADAAATPVDHPEVDDDDELPTDENGDPVTDDGEILDEEPEPDRDRERGEWPDSEDVGPPVGDDEPATWPEDEGETEAPDVDAPPADEPVTDDAVVLEDDAGGETTAAADARSVTTDPSTAVDGQSDAATRHGNASATVDDATGSGIERATSAKAPGQNEGPREDTPTEFFCPNCDYVASGDRGSLRAGDICPECRKGYLGERERR